MRHQRSAHIPAGPREADSDFVLRQWRAADPDVVPRRHAQRRPPPAAFRADKPHTQVISRRVPTEPIDGAVERYHRIVGTRQRTPRPGPREMLCRLRERRNRTGLGTIAASGVGDFPGAHARVRQRFGASVTSLDVPSRLPIREWRAGVLHAPKIRYCPRRPASSREGGLYPRGGQDAFP